MRGDHVLKTAIVSLAILAILAVSRGTDLAPSLNADTATPIPNLMPQQPEAAQTDEDEKLDDQFRKFGSAAGAAYQCSPESGREQLVSDVRRAYSRIGQLFGTDRAFYFAAHFGRAVDGPFDKAKCPELIRRLRESILVRGLAR